MLLTIRIYLKNCQYYNWRTHSRKSNWSDEIKWRDSQVVLIVEDTNSLSSVYTMFNWFNKCKIKKPKLWTILLKMCTFLKIWKYTNIDRTKWNMGLFYLQKTKNFLSRKFIYLAWCGAKLEWKLQRSERKTIYIFPLLWYKVN